MTVDRDFINVTDLAILRPPRNRPGLDAGAAAEVATGILAAYEPRVQQIKSETGEDQTITAVLRIDGVDSAGNPLDIRSGDLARWTDARGRLQKPQRILRAVQWFSGTDIDHLELGIG